MLSEHPSSEETDPASTNDRDAEGNDMETEQHDQMDSPNSTPTSPNSSPENTYYGLGQKIAASTEETNQSDNKNKTMSTNMEGFDKDKELFKIYKP